jgi:hypothetical protein
MNISSFEDTAHASRTATVYYIKKTCFILPGVKNIYNYPLHKIHYTKMGLVKKNFVKAMIQEAQVSTTSR